MCKKRFVLVLVILCIVESVVMGGLLIDRYTNPPKNGFIGNEANDGSVDAELFPSESYQELCEYLYRLDISMLQDERNAYSNFDKYETVNSYIEQLKDVKKSYYDILINSGNDSAILELENFDSKWEGYIADEMNKYQSLLEQQFGSGTIVPIILAKHEYMLYRSWVVDVFELCLAFQSF